MRLKSFEISTVIIMLFVLGFSGHCVSAADKLTIEGIIDLCSSGKPESTLIREIRDRGIDFEVNTSVMQRLMQNGVSAGIIEVLLGVSGSGSKSGVPVSVDYGPASPSLNITSHPPGALVILDGETKGVTPFLSNKVSTGKHHVRIDHPLFFAFEKSFEFDGKNSQELNINLESREPMIRLNVSIANEEESVPWTWLARPRSKCPDQPTVDLKPIDSYRAQNEAVFVLTEESKQTFQTNGNACLEVLIWRGRIRTDMPSSQLPPHVSRYLITNIEIWGVQFVDLLLDIQIPRYNLFHPKVELRGSTGTLVDTGDSMPTPSPEELLNQFNGMTDKNK